MGSPQVRLEPRGGAKPFLYASSDDNSGGYASSEETDETDEDTVGQEADEDGEGGRNGRRFHSGSSKGGRGGGAGSHAAGGRDRRGSSGASSAASRKRSKSSTGPSRAGGGGGGSDDRGDTEGYNSTGGGWGGRRGSGRLRSNSTTGGGGGRRNRRRSGSSKSRESSTARDKSRHSSSRKHEKRHSAAPMVYRKPAAAATRSSSRLDGGPGSLLGLLGSADGEDAVPVVAVRKPGAGGIGSGFGGVGGDKSGRAVPMFLELGSRLRSPSLTAAAATAAAAAAGKGSMGATADEKALEALKESFVGDPGWAGTGMGTGTPPASRRESSSLPPPSPAAATGTPPPDLVSVFQPTPAPRLRRRASSPLLSSLDAPLGGASPYGNGGENGGEPTLSAGTGATTVPAAVSVVPFSSHLLPRMGSSGTVGDVLGGAVEVGVGEGARGRGGRESAILKALAKGSSLQEAVGDTNRRGTGVGGGRSISVGGDLSSLASLAEARGRGVGDAATESTASPSAAEAQEPLVAVVALPTPASGSQAAMSASSVSVASNAAAVTTAATTVAGGAGVVGGAKLGRTSSMSMLSSSSHAPLADTAASNAAAATATKKTVACGAGVVGGTPLGRTSSIGKLSSASYLPHVPERLSGAAGAPPPTLPLTRAADSTGSFGSMQLGGTRVSSAPPVGSGSGGGGGKGAGVAGATGGMVPRKDRLLNILGQNKFTPRKDYPPSSMLFQVRACLRACVLVSRLFSG